MFSADLGGAPVAAAPAATDPPFQKVALLLHGDGTNGAQNNTFVDGSSNNFTITRTGNVAQGTFSPFSLAEGQWSNYFDGSGDYLTVPASTALDFGTGDFTVEWWQYWNGTQSSYGTLYNNNYGSAPNLLIQTNANVNQYIVYMNGTSTTITESSAASANQWYHYAVVRNGTTVTIYRNGVSTGSTTYSGNVGSSVTTYIGTGGSGPYTITASYLSNFRIVKGTAVYTANFTPPTSALTAITNTSLLTCQSNRFKDNSSNNFTITRNGDTKVTAFSPFAPSAAYSASTNGGSAFFDGSGDYLTTPQNAAFNFGTGAFTVEAWVYLTAYPSGGSSAIASLGNGAFGSSVYNGWSLIVTNTGGILWYRYDGTETTYTSSIAVQLNQWTHIAVSRNGSSNLSIYVNGVRSFNSSSASTSYNNVNSNPLNISYFIAGPNTQTTRYLTGYIQGIRIVNGTAVYDPTQSTLTVPTSPVTAITNTQLLLNCTNAGIIDNAGKNDIETVGNAQISTSVKKYGTGSMAFDGTGDYLALPTNQNFAMGTGDFTIECWAYAASGGTNNGIWMLSNSYGVNTTYQLAVTFALPNIFVNANGTSAFTSGVTISTGNWYHLALVRSSNTTKLYVDGVSRITFASDSTNYTHTYLTIGGYYSTGYLLNGYIDDLRITKGQAMYTSNFTPPTQAFPNV